MTCSTQKFVSYTSYPSNRQITIADGTTTMVAGQDDLYISKYITLKNALLVPKLFTNFVLI